jgi:hypothetical protein
MKNLCFLLLVLSAFSCKKTSIDDNSLIYVRYHNDTGLDLKDLTVINADSSTVLISSNLKDGKQSDYFSKEGYTLYDGLPIEHLHGFDSNGNSLDINYLGFCGVGLVIEELEPGLHTMRLYKPSNSDYIWMELE